jgi:hypothetical protein
MRRPETPNIKTPAVDNALRSILSQLNDGPVATKLDQPAAMMAHSRVRQESWQRIGGESPPRGKD